MPKLVINDITSGYASVDTLNSNFTAIETALENTLSRDGTTPNSMSADLDMNGYAVLNQRAVAGETNFIWKGTWVVGGVYAKNNLVYAPEGTNIGNTLICVTANTAGSTLDGDAAKWAVFAQRGAPGASGGDVQGPASSTADSLVRFNGTTGKVLKDGAVIGTHVQAYSANLATFATKTFIDDDSMSTAGAAVVASSESLKAYIDLLHASSVRQAIVSGPVNTSGFASFGGSTGSTTVTATGTLVVNSSNGNSNRVGTITNPSWTGLSTNGTMYLFLDVAAGGTCTTGSTTLAPTYRWGGADVVTNLQNTFNIQEMQMKVGNGATASQVWRVFVGEVTVVTGVVSTISWYQIKDSYANEQGTLAFSTAYSFSHNIGKQDLAVSFWYECTTNDLGYVIGDRIYLTSGDANGTQQDGGPFWTTAKTCGLTVGGGGGSRLLQISNKTTGAVANLTIGSWKLGFIIKRAW